MYNHKHINGALKMLDFIVLGHVPGTHIELTFLQVLGLAAGFVLILAILNEIHVRRKLIRKFVTFKHIKKTLKRQTA